LTEFIEKCMYQYLQHQISFISSTIKYIDSVFICYCGNLDVVTSNLERSKCVSFQLGVMLLHAIFLANLVIHSLFFFERLNISHLFYTCLYVLLSITISYSPRAKKLNSSPIIWRTVLHTQVTFLCYVLCLTG
jgi:hypothetical protein